MANMALTKDIRNLIQKTSLQIEQLEDITEERYRLIKVLLLTPSSNDNYDVTQALEKVLKYLNYITDDINEAVEKGEMIFQDYEEIKQHFHDVLNKYQTIVDSLEDDEFISISEFRFPTPELPSLENPVKSVRFKDSVEFEGDSTNSKFKPYKDDDSVASLGSIPDHQMFAQQQQQILIQDDNLDSLHKSVARQHEMGININSEIDEHLILLSDLESGVDRSQNLINSATQRIKSFRQKCRENGSLVTIVILTVILILLLVVLG